MNTYSEISRYQKTHARGVQFYKDNKFQQACTAFANALDMVTENSHDQAITYYCAAMANFHLAQYRIALDLMEKSHSIKLSLQEDVNKSGFAIAKFKALIKARTLANDGGAMAMRESRYQDAANIYSKVIEKYEYYEHQTLDLAACHANLGTCYSYLNKKADAIKEYESALKLKKELGGSEDSIKKTQGKLNQLKGVSVTASDASTAELMKSFQQLSESMSQLFSKISDKLQETAPESQNSFVPPTANP